MDCVFCRIVSGEIPSNKVYEDDDIIIIKDITPQALHHYLLLPKEHYENLAELDMARGEVLMRGIMKVNELKEQLGLADGYRVVSNCGSVACQTVFHLHIHILGGEKLSNKMA